MNGGDHITHRTLPPESTTIGLLGSGQLGRMFAVAAQRMGYRVHVYSPAANSPASHAACCETVAHYEDHEALGQFAEQVDVVTLEFENIAVESVRWLEQKVPVRPGARVLEITQHRLLEKTTLANAGVPVANFAAVNTLAEVQQAAIERTPGVLKTAVSGYDGKGQATIRTADDVESAWHAIQGQAAVLEGFVDFQCELSVVAARSQSGNIVTYDPIRNDHDRHILDVSICPSGLPDKVVASAKQLAANIMEALQVVGVMCVEMFLTRDHQLIVNELAPRPHNSGHLTIEAHAVSQFEQQVRAVCGLPLASTAQRQPAAMCNLLGELWTHGQPDFRHVMSLPNTYLHLYGKQEPRSGRKMGHITVLAQSPEEAASTARHVRDLLQASPKSDPSRATDAKAANQEPNSTKNLA